MTNKANVYPKSSSNPTISYSDNSRANIGVCFSGGGSRALTCAWGQLIGLTTLQYMEKVRYISSVSGGTWASSIYTYLPGNISDSELLGKYTPPDGLSLSDDTGGLNVNNMGEYNLGQAPLGMQLDTLVVKAACFFLLNDEKDHKWLWANLIAELVLEPFELRAQGDESWSSSNSFSLSAKFAEDNFPADAPPLNKFFFLRPGRPFIIMNDNIMQKVPQTSDKGISIVQLPNQATPVSTGVQGRTPGAEIVGGGSASSYGFASKLAQASAYTSPVDIDISQPYSLIDIVSTSSAFFAETIASLVSERIQDPVQKKELVSQLAERLEEGQKESLLARAVDDQLDLKGIEEVVDSYLDKKVLQELSSHTGIVPSYNYWPIAKISENRLLEFTDGGTLDNTGIVGMLAQTDDGSADQSAINLIAFDNTSTVMQKVGGNIIAADQAAPLFGIDFDSDTGKYKAFTPSQQDPTQGDFVATSLLTVFDNSKGASGKTMFDILLEGLYAANCGAMSGGDGTPDSEPAFYQMKLVTVDNSLANVTAGREVNLLYVQNARINSWQKKIGDPELAEEIANGQKEGIDPFVDFKDFPYYSTFTKVGLQAKESNSLAQMWAWAVGDEESPLRHEVAAFFGE